MNITSSRLLIITVGAGVAKAVSQRNICTYSIRMIFYNTWRDAIVPTADFLQISHSLLIMYHDFANSSTKIVITLF